MTRFNQASHDTTKGIIAHKVNVSTRTQCQSTAIHHFTSFLQLMSSNQSAVSRKVDEFVRAFKRQAVDSGEIGKLAQKIELILFSMILFSLMALFIESTFFIISGLVIFFYCFPAVRIVWLGSDQSIFIHTVISGIIACVGFAGMVTGFVLGAQCAGTKRTDCGGLTFAAIMWLFLMLGFVFQVFAHFVGCMHLSFLPPA